MSEKSRLSVPEILTVVTAANQLYGACLNQLLDNARRRGLEKGRRFIAYDLGLEAPTRRRLEARHSWCEFRDFRFADYPPHVAIAARTYAWKPVIVAEVFAAAAGGVLWLDSATLIRTSLDEVAGELRRRGMYVLRGQSPIREQCDPKTLAAVGAPLEILDRPEIAAGVIGLHPAFPVVRRLIATWREQALQEAVIAPTRPLPSFHKPEQALLGILVRTAERAGELDPVAGEIDISSPSPVRWMTSRNKLVEGRPRWTDPLARIGFGLYKWGDRLGLRAKRFHARRVSGFHRLPKEHFQVWVARDPMGGGGTAATDGAARAGGLDGGARIAGIGPAVPLSAPWTSYYADPFGWKRAGRTFLFMEEFLYAENRGRLVVAELDAGLRAGPVRPLELGRTHHFSFPFLLEEGGETYLFPETSAIRSVDLYRCVEWPARWQLARRFFLGLDAADSTLLRRDGRWWLFTSLRTGAGAGARALAIYHTDDLLAGSWTPHPVNEEERYGDRPFSFGRCAGSFLRGAAGETLRPIHSSRHFYGESVALRRIDELTPERFRESEAPPASHPLGEIAARVSPHHISAGGGLLAWDVRTRIAYFRQRSRK